MLLVDRRYALVNFCLAGMEMAWFLPFWLLIFSPSQPPWLSYMVLLAAQLAWIVLLDLLNRTQLAHPAFDLAALGLLILTSLLAVGLSLFQGRTADQAGGEIWQSLQSALDFSKGFPPGLALLVANLFLWQRATNATSRELSFFSVGVSFRLGLLLLIASAGLFTRLRGGNLLPLLWVYVGMGLTAIAVARINEKAAGAQSAGKPLPARRLLQLLLAVGVTAGCAALLSHLYSPAGLSSLFERLSPLWALLRPVIDFALWLLVVILTPILAGFESLLRGLLSGYQAELQPVPAPEELRLPSQLDFASRIPEWVWAALLRGAIALAIVIGVLLLIALLFAGLEKTRRASRQAEAEEESLELMSAGGGILTRGLRAWGGALRRMRSFELSRGLLAAISVENIYANLCRLARLRGYGRRPSQPPDDYLPTLAQAFAGQEAALARITAAYMRVHYGDHPVDAVELAQVREDYRAVRRVFSDQGPS